MATSNSSKASDFPTIDISSSNNLHKETFRFSQPGENLTYIFRLASVNPINGPKIDHITIEYVTGPRYKIDYSSWRTD